MPSSVPEEPGKSEEATEDAETTAKETGDGEEGEKKDKESVEDKVEKMNIDVEVENGESKEPQKGCDARTFFSACFS